jgi:putative oxidoreductase
MTSYESYAAVAGRVLISLIFLISGIQKIGDYAGTVQEIQSAGLPFPVLAYIVAVIVEIGVALAVLLGFRTRLAAAVMCVYTLAAALSFHAHFADPNQAIHFWKNIAIAGGFLMIVAFGAGALSIDARNSPARHT